MDASGRETYAMLGSGALNVQTLYDRVNGLVREIRTGLDTDTTVQHLAYGWDRVGNLTSRTDNNQSLTEAFTYDALNRLNGSTLNAYSG